MDDSQIVELCWQRREEAITETDKRYGQSLKGLALRILANHEDANECTSDTYLRAWESIPPQRPVYLFAYLAKICRFLCFDRLDRLNAAKRRAEVVQLTAEMEQCIPDTAACTEQEDDKLGQLLNAFLETLPSRSRIIFLRRYWYADSIREIARRCGITESSVKTQLHRTRSRLKTYLQKEGIQL